MDAGEFGEVSKLFVAASKHLKSGGAQAMVLCANTMHMFADDIEREVQIPVIHIATATAASIKAHVLNTVALLGTKFTMERNFFKDKLTALGIKALIPGEADKDFIHNTIFDEMGKGIFTDATRDRYIAIIEDLAKQGAQGAILGCTEIPMLLGNAYVSVPTFDTTKLHADAAIAFSLG